MVQLVFVHGVNVRKGPGYDTALAEVTRRLTSVSFKGASLSVRAPYWGEYGAPALYDCIPNVNANYGSLALQDSSGDAVLLDAARIDFPGVVASLSAAGLEEARTQGSSDDAKTEAEQFWEAAALYAEARPAPPWLNQVTTDDEFLDRLILEAKAMQPLGAQDLGLGDFARKAAAKVTGGLLKLASPPLARLARERVSPYVAVFIGDVFRYLKDGDARTKIRGAVMGSIVAAAKAQAEGEKLILTGHSMGAVILYDILSDGSAVARIEHELGRPLDVDLFLSIGSQVALFEELKVYEQSGKGRPASAAKAPRPAPARLWWNVFDKMDVLSFLCQPVFYDVQDWEMDTIAGVLDAHGAYFDSMPFYVRLGTRLKGAGLA